ncbi:hypothetical protein [Flexithrix dorotheae]|uniref:hypothetical protein n=1 Tax=Flexithrix dorotheae TaxID=70993 RepID=UPI00037C1133|nr:hypothetical protein [Flexithrix dorotheae]
MFGFFKRNKKEKPKSEPQLIDLNNNVLEEGDIVESLRYELGKCKIIKIEGKFYYESLESGKQVIWVKMIDASNDLQKVKKVGL